ncbi:MAG TPA: hypothetical protein VMZ24_06100 [Patescibacteria group bacterium]|nr:hypothetical protein [Patescibacteria group bacterium]
MEYEDRFLILGEQLNRWDGRRRQAEAMLWIPRALLAGLSVAVIIAIFMRLFPLVDNRTFLLLTCLLAITSLVACLLISFMSRRTLLTQARYADEQLDLFERASTAVEINAGKVTAIPSITLLQLNDTLVAIASADGERVIPLRWHWREVALLLLVVVLLIAAGLAPNSQSDILEQQAAVSQSIEVQIEALEEIEQAINQSELLNQGLQEQLQAPILKAIEALQHEDLNREQAVAVLSEAEADLRELSDRLNNNAIEQSLREAGRPLLDNPSGRQLGEAIANSDLFGAGEAANNLADSIPTLIEEERTALAQDLAQTAAALQEVAPDLAAELSGAARALQSGDIETAQEALRKAVATLQQRAQEQAAANMAASTATQLDEGSQQVARAGQTDEAAGQGDGQDSAGSSPRQGAGDGNSMGQGAEMDPTSEQGQAPGGPGFGGGPAESVYVPGRFELDAGEGIDVELPAECAGDPDGCGALVNESAVEFGDEKSLVPYQQVFADYRDTAFEALEGDYIPLGMKEYVRDYFTSLEP